MSRITKYSKAIIAGIGLAASVLTALNVHYAWVPAVIAAATALGVYQIPNKHRPAATASPAARPVTHP